MNTKFAKPVSKSPSTTAPVSTPKARQHQSDALDEALKESFPASDPVAINFGRPDKKKAPPKA